MTELLQLAGAAALLLWGLRMVRTGVSRAFGARLRHWLALGTSNRIKSFATGLVVTCILQSSTATGLMTSSFAARKMITPVMALAVLLGADLGTSLVARAYAFDVGWLSPLFVLIGVIVFMARDASFSHAIGRALIGLGLMLLALKLLSNAAAPMRESEVVQSLLQVLAAAPLLASIIAGVMTVISSSSLAVILLVVTLSVHGDLAPIVVVAMVLGANVGSSALPVLSTLSLGSQARLPPLANMVMRLCGAVIAFPFAGAISHAYIFHVSPDLPGMTLNLHIFFNIALALVFLPIIDFLPGLMRFLLPKDDVGSETGPRYLDESCLDNPAMALSCATRETMRMGDCVEAMLKSSREAFTSNNATLCGDISRIDDEVDQLLEEIKLYLSKLGRHNELEEDVMKQSIEIVSYAINLEHAGDIIDHNLNDLLSKKIKGQRTFSKEGGSELEAFFNRSLENLRIAQSVFVSRDAKLARDLLNQKVDVRNIERRSAHAHLERLREGRPETLQTSSLHLDILRDLKRVNAHIIAVAYPILEDAGALSKSRLKEQHV